MKNAILLITALALGASAEDMKFTMRGGTAMTAAGQIVEDTPQKFAAFLRANPAVKLVRLDSIGGSVEASLEIGRMIRKAGLMTFVGGVYGGNGDMTAANIIDYGECVSACVWVFAGGSVRAFDPLGGIIGIHQFYFEGAQGKADNAASAQYAMATIGRYLDEMGVGRDILDMAAMAGSAPQALPGYMAQKVKLAMVFIDQDAFCKKQGK